MTTIRIPDLVGAVDQFRTAVCYDYEGALRAGEEWFARYNVMSPTKLKAVHNSAKVGLLGAIIYPLSDKKSLRLAIDMFILFMAYDDPFDEDALRLDESVATEFTNTVVSALTDTENFQPVPNLPVITAYHDFVVRLRAESTACAYKRFVDAMVEWILFIQKQIEMRVHNKYPAIEEYVLFRRVTVGMKPCFVMVEISRRIDVPDSVIQHPTIRVLLDISTDIVLLINDICSFNKEQARGDYFNIVSIVCIEKKIPVQSAIEYVFVMFESAIRRWLDARAQIPKFDPQTDEIVSKYFEGLEYLIGGFAHWHWKAERYLGPQECRGEVKNALIKVLPLEPGSPQMPADIRYNA
ncbi:hypothetical protein MMC31_003965 [Peltigera leucophlebia]|nr:hypothetical protein [Peltigera leucophlebia]